MGWTVAFVVVFWIVCGAVSGLIAERKRLNVGVYLFGGLLLGPLGVLLAIGMPAGAPPAPPGMETARCTRCNAVQNVLLEQHEFECWQCKTTNAVARTPPPAPEPPPLSDEEVSANEARRKTQDRRDAYLALAAASAFIISLIFVGIMKLVQ